MNTILFWFSLLFIVYTYLGYPLILFVLSFIRRKQIYKKHSLDLPYVSIVIAAKNEEGLIAGRLKNLLQQDYPSKLLEIVVVSDNSTDDTALIVERLAEATKTPKIILLHQDMGQGGKPAALNKGVLRAKGEVIVFADCRQRYSEEAIRQLIANFQDQTVGCVSGELLFVEDSESDIEVEMGAYWKYEKLIRKLESATGSVVGATGAIYAIRKNLFKPLPDETLLDDVLVPLNVAEQGMRVIFDGAATAFDTISNKIGNEWKRKTRTLAGNWQLLSLNTNLINPLSSPLWWRLFSHKISRLLVPFFLTILIVSSFQESGIFPRMVLWIQTIVYLSAVLGHFVPSVRKYIGLGLTYFFCVLNLAAFVGWCKWITGKTETGWK